MLVSGTGVYTQLRASHQNPPHSTQMLHSDTFKDEISTFTLPSYKIQKSLPIHQQQTLLSYAPLPIKLPTWSFCIDTHEQKDMFVVGYMDGSFECFNYEDFANVESVFKVAKHGDNAVQDVHFLASDRGTVSADTSGTILLYDLNRDKTKLQIKDAHDGASVHKVLECEENHIFASGDENGVVKIWDTRLKGCIRTIDEHGDEITGMMYNEDSNALYVSSADGSVSHIEISKNVVQNSAGSGKKKKKKSSTQSAAPPADLASQKAYLASQYRAKLYDISKPVAKKTYTSVIDMLQGETIICGTGSGKIDVYNYATLYHSSKGIRLEAEPIDHLLFLKENIFCAVSGKGSLNAFRLEKEKQGFQVKLAQHIGEHEESVTACALDSEGKFIVAVGMDQHVRFFDTRDLFGLSRPEDETAEQMVTEDAREEAGEDADSERAKENDDSAAPTQADTRSEISAFSTNTTSSRKRANYLAPAEQQKKKKRKLVSKFKDFFSDL